MSFAKIQSHGVQEKTNWKLENSDVTSKLLKEQQKEAQDQCKKEMLRNAEVSQRLADAERNQV